MNVESSRKFPGNTAKHRVFECSVLPKIACCKNFGDKMATAKSYTPIAYWRRSSRKSFCSVVQSTTREFDRNTVIPHRVAIAIQDAGYTIRQDVVWHKRSPMPESVSGWRFKGGKLRRGSWRHTNAHEYVFMITKSRKYFCDGDAVREPVSGNAHSRGKGHPKATKGKRAKDGKQNADFAVNVRGLVDKRNPRAVNTNHPDWGCVTENESILTLSTEPYKEAHFATFPTGLIRPLITASTSAGGCCNRCGQCYAPIVEAERVPTRPGNDTKTEGRNAKEIGNRDPRRHVTVTKTTGYGQTCSCQESTPEPCVVLDPFAGSGTTGLVAMELGHKFIGAEVSHQYAIDIAILRFKRIRE